MRRGASSTPTKQGGNGRRFRQRGTKCAPLVPNPYVRRGLCASSSRTRPDAFNNRLQPLRNKGAWPVQVEREAINVHHWFSTPTLEGGYVRPHRERVPRRPITGCNPYETRRLGASKSNETQDAPQTRLQPLRRKQATDVRCNIVTPIFEIRLSYFKSQIR